MLAYPDAKARLAQWVVLREVVTSATKLTRTIAKSSVRADSGEGEVRFPAESVGLTSEGKISGEE